jgi:NAD(P)-dependent dehydrogenase (short-subunit alcohol dehydrogenase family)
MRVVLADVDKLELERAAEALVKSGAEAISIPCDVSSPEQVDALARQTLSAFGAVHVVCNNAGVAGTGGKLWELEPDDWTRVLGINLVGVVNGIRAFIPILLQQDEGHVVNTASAAGLISAVLGDYSVTKHGVVALSEALYYDLVGAGASVGVSVLCPGWVRTNIGSSRRQTRQARSDPQRRARDELILQKLAEGMDASEVADHVVQAIRTGKFYVLTHGQESIDAVETRFADILEGHHPTPPSAL